MCHLGAALRFRKWYQNVLYLEATQPKCSSGNRGKKNMPIASIHILSAGLSQSGDVYMEGADYMAGTDVRCLTVQAASPARAFSPQQ